MRWIVLLLTLASSAAAGEITPPSPYFEALAAQPGAEVTRRTDGDAEIGEVRLGGVLLEEIRRGGQVRSLATDRSGHGAVLCAWHIQIAVRAALALCPHDGDRALQEDADRAVQDITDFILANDPMRAPRTEWVARMELIESDLRTAATRTASGRNAERCPTDTVDDLVSALRRTTREQRRQAVAGLLSVPRPPVMAPCL